MRKQPRWMKSVIAASKKEAAKLPYDRKTRTPVIVRRALANDTLRQAATA